MPKLYPYLLMLLLGVFAVNIHQVAAQCSDFTFTTTVTNVKCYNGGACGNGKCSCPTGFENSQCQTKSVARFLGGYAGYITCSTNGTPDGAETIDSAFIYADTSAPAFINYVWVVWKHIAPTVLHGYVQANQSTYSIIVPADTTSGFPKVYTITLQDNNSLNIGLWEQSNIPGDTTVTKCTFLGADTATVH